MSRELHHVPAGSMRDLFFSLPVFLFFPFAASCWIVRGLAQSSYISAAGRSHRPQRRPSAAALGLARRLGVPEVVFICVFSHHASHTSFGSFASTATKLAVCEVTRRSRGLLLQSGALATWRRRDRHVLLVGSGPWNAP